MKVLVIGAGISGQLVQWLVPSASLSDALPTPAIPQTTRSWGTNYLWKPLEGIRCRPFTVITHVDGCPATQESVLAYKTKIGKQNDGGDWGLQFQTETTGWEFDEPLSPRVRWGRRLVDVELENRRASFSDGSVVNYDWLVSTIPAYQFFTVVDQRPVLEELIGGLFNFRWNPIYVRAIPRPPDAPFPPEVLYVNYVTPQNVKPYRFCDRGTERHYEGLTRMDVFPTRRLVPGKIWPLEIQPALDHLRKYGVVCFGRFATWRPDELVHDTFADIQQWVQAQS